MLTKEYRISLPMSVEEYRIAQLYMIQKKSRNESRGTESGVEIIENKPYKDGPGGDGQYTYKIFHIGSHLPGWFRAILPKSALRVEEEAWNAYPYTKTRYKCPFIEKFLLEVETKYLNDAGDDDTVFSLTKSEKSQRTVDYIDIVKDPIASGDYHKEEDPKLYKSKNTGRGPLTEEWRKEYGQALKKGGPGRPDMMTAYKLCKVEFKYWGMQGKIERFIHDVALRKTMLRAHRQAWSWQDEYYGLSLDDIRQLERETQLALAEKMAAALEEGGISGTSGSGLGSSSMDTPTNERSGNVANANQAPSSFNQNPNGAKGGKPPSPSLSIASSSIHFTTASDRPPHSSPSASSSPHSRSETAAESSSRVSSAQAADFTRSMSMDSTKTVMNGGDGGRLNIRRPSHSSSHGSSRNRITAGSSPVSPGEWSSLEQLQEPSSDEEFFDAQDVQPMGEDGSDSPGLMIRSSSMDILPNMEDSMDSTAFAAHNLADGGEEPQFNKRVEQFRQMYSLDSSLPLESSMPASASACPTQILFLVLHGGNILDSSSDPHPKRRDLANLRASLDSVIQSHYQAASQRVQMRLVHCPNMTRESLALLSSLSPFNSAEYKSSSMEMNVTRSQSFVPLGAISLFSMSTADHQERVNASVSSANQVYHDFLQSEEGMGFSGQVCLLADAMGSLLAYDALTSSVHHCGRAGSHYSSHESVDSSAIAAELSSSPHDGAQHYHQHHSHHQQAMTHSSRELSLSDPNLNPGQGAAGLSLSAPIRTERSKSEVAPPSCLDLCPLGGEEAAGKSAGAYAGSGIGTGASLRVSSRHNSGHLNNGRDGQGRNMYRRSTSDSQCGGGLAKFDFDVCDFFMCGSPLGMVLAYRRIVSGYDGPAPKPACHQVYNLFHSNDPTAVRLEPLIHDGFGHIPPMNVCRYSKFPLGDGEPVHVVETIQKNMRYFMAESKGQGLMPESHGLQRQSSLSSVTSTSSGLGENTVSSITNVTNAWWGVKRVDYVLYSPEALHSFPTNALPHLFHSSFWESTDVLAFVLRQVLRRNEVTIDSNRGMAADSVACFKIKSPREKWLKRRTTIKVRNLQPNHRANDVIVVEDRPQILTAKFVYGSLDISSLSGEKVDVNIMIQPPSGDWTLMGTEVTDSHGRFSYTVPLEKKLSQGMYPVKLVVRGDHTSVDFFLTVLPPKTETVVFSIDGSFTASVSIMGKDPKVRAGAVDVVRHWQDLGYLILYVSARPDLQHRKVVSWLAQHNFPHGMVAFMDGLSKDPLKQKYNYIKSLQTEAEIDLKAAYGSSKDIGIYKDLGLQPLQIFIVGKASKKQHTQAQVLSDGYSVHLGQLMSPAFSRPASGNARMFLRKSNFRLSAHDPHHHPSQRESKKMARRAVSHPTGHCAELLDSSTTRIVVQDFSSGGASAAGGGGSGRSKGLHLSSAGKSSQV